jgi:SAM-dependent methyltransferase
MLAEARTLHNVDYVLGDIHFPPLAGRSFRLAVSSFGLNTTTPKKSLRAAADLLRPGGVLAFQEWAVMDAAERTLGEAISDHLPEEVPSLDPILTEYYMQPNPWDDTLQDCEDYYDLLKQIGFRDVWVKEALFTAVHFEQLDSYIWARLAWPKRRLALAALSDSARADFMADLHNRAQQFLNPDGSFDWKPTLFRVFAVK